MATKRRTSGTRTKRAPARAAPVPADPATAFELKDDEVERALQTGAYGGLLEDYFGPEAYAELRQLKRDAAARTLRGGPKVLILPGIMGSKIGRDRKLIPFDDLKWLDPIDIAAGRLTDLALPDGGRHRALGVMLIAYLKLKLRLQRAGYDADFYPFDWRRSIDELGDELKAKLKGKQGESTALVAHSMGGLVARSALAKGARCRRLVMLGTPNHGSFAPVMAFRGTYPVVRKIGWLDRKHTAEELSRDVFSTFPGLTQMLPFRGHYDALDLYQLEVWPEADRGYAPRAAVLRDAPRVQQSLAAGDERMFLIAGVDQKTVVGIRLPEDGSAEFLYEFSTAGDGTVPLQFAQLPGVKATYYVAEGHGSLANNSLVATAVLDLLEREHTNVLPASYERPAERAAIEVVPESQLRVEPYDGTRGGALSQRELRELAEEVAAPDSHEALQPTLATAPGAATSGPPAAGFDHVFDRVRVGRNNYHRIDLRFAYGSITETDTRAVVLGLFRDVAPAGAASAVDRRMDGAITDLYRRRMFSGNVGEVFMLPTGRHQLVTDFITFVGLGPFDQFSGEVLQTASENIVRTMISARIEEFSTVLYGGGSGQSPASALSNMLTGFLRGLADADRDHHFRRIVICENDRERYLAIKEELYRLSSTTLCENVELTFDEVVLRAEPQFAAPARAVRREQPIYLIVRQERADRGTVDIRTSLLTAGDRAAIISGVQTADTAALERARLKVVSQKSADFSASGRALAGLVLSEQVLAVLPRYRKYPLVVVHDAATAQIPWETLGFGEARTAWFPAAEQGLSHRYAAENLSVAKWLEERVHDNVLNVLLVVNPTSDLAGAEREGERVRALLGQQSGTRLTVLRRGEATRQALLAAFSSGSYDVVHYAGHAEFDERHPARSGIVCAGGVRLTGADLAGVSRLPTLVFFNACESGRVRAAKNGAGKPKPRVQHVADNVGLAEAFMRGGVANFLGTYWPVGDAEADAFAATFYGDLVTGKTIGEALLNGRSAVRTLKSPDWANYILYGNADFALKQTG
ncbi:MAG TPA: CHAT domain-containing protein [Longimicrobiales bacterium]|nr:CHAT domain-containing protein [Longimicrobiales bacterium]